MGSQASIFKAEREKNGDSHPASQTASFKTL